MQRRSVRQLFRFDASTPVLNIRQADLTAISRSIIDLSDLSRQNIRSKSYLPGLNSYGGFTSDLDVMLPQSLTLFVSQGHQTKSYGCAPALLSPPPPRQQSRRPSSNRDQGWGRGSYVDPLCSQSKPITVRLKFNRQARIAGGPAGAWGAERDIFF